MENKFLKAQSYFVFSFIASCIATFAALYYIPGGGAVLSYVLGFSFVLSAAIITQFFFLGVLLDNRARNVPVSRDEWFSAFTFYFVCFGVIAVCFLISYYTKFPWGVAVGSASGVIIPSLVTIITTRGFPWVEKKKISTVED